MRTLHRLCVLSSTLIAAAMILGGGQVRAGYVSTAALLEGDGVNALVSPVEMQARDGMTAAGETWQPQSDTDGSHGPSGIFSLLESLSFAAYNFAHGGRSGSSSQSVSSNGPSSYPAGSLPRPQVPPLELTNLLPPQTGDAHPFSVASFLFRPPRAA